MKIMDDMLDDSDIEYRQTPNISGKFGAGQPDTMVIHFTGGSSAASSVNHLCNKSAKASAHIVIGRDGRVYQLAPFNLITWHAGKSSWNDKHGLNRYAIGVELDNAGELTDNRNGKYVSWFNRTYQPEEVFLGVHRNRTTPSYWHTYTETQIEKSFEVCQLICEHYKIHEIVGHEEISPHRKSDPGPAFPLERMRERLLTDNRKIESATDDRSTVSSPDRIVEVSKLNVRTGPGTHFGLSDKPLNEGTIVEPIRSINGWTQVKYTVTGWVSNRYLGTSGLSTK